jgi:esterase
VIHGVEDPIFPPAHAEKMAELIPDAKLLLINQMGHALNPIFFNKITQAIIDHTTTS